MVSEEQPEDAAGLAEVQARADDALREAERLLEASEGWPPADAFGPVIGQLVGVEADLAQRGADFAVVFVHLGILFGARWLSGGGNVPADSTDRTEALRRLRWTDRNGPPGNLLVVQARMMLVFLLAPWALPRGDGSRTALLDALLAAADERVLTESLRRDLTEAGQVVDRLAAAAPLDAEFQARTARVKATIERMLTPGPGPSAIDAADARSADAEAPGTDSSGSASTDATPAHSASADATSPTAGSARTTEEKRRPAAAEGPAGQTFPPATDPDAPIPDATVAYANEPHVTKPCATDPDAAITHATTPDAAVGHAGVPHTSARTPAPGPDPADNALLDAVRGLVALAPSRSTARFTRTLVWLNAQLHTRNGARNTGCAHETLELDPEAGPLLDKAGVGSAAGVAGVRRAADLVLRELRALPPDAPERARVARLHAYLLVNAETMEPGSVDFGTAERPVPEPDGDSRGRLEDWPAGITPEPGLAAHLDGRLLDFLAHLGVRERRSAAGYDRLLAYRTGDPGYLEDAALLLREAVEASPPDSWWVVSLRAELAEILRQAAAFGGSFQDADISLATLRGLDATLRRDGSLPPDAPFALSLSLSTADGELLHAERTGNHEALPRLLEDLRGRYAVLPPDSPWRGEVSQRLSRLDEVLADARQSTGRQAATAAPTAGPATVPEATTTAADPAAEREALKRAVADMRRALDEPAVYHEAEYDRRAALGLRLLLCVVRGEEDPAVLDEAVVELSRARELLAEGRGGTRRVDVLMKLAEAHIMRAARRGPHAVADVRAFVEITREALAELAADVLLQIGADHGLSAALNGAVLSRRLAFAALRAGRSAEAVADLEQGRAVVLQAAAVSRSLPQLLETAGHPELARQWRAQVPAVPLRPETGEIPPPSPGEAPIPSGLRRRALAVLGVRPGAGERPGVRQLPGVAGVAELTAGLAATGTDALVYLVAGMPLPNGPAPGHALILRPGAEPAVLPLPHLMVPGSAPLERYFDAAAERSRALTDPDMHSSWRAAWEGHWQVTLDELCEWAWKAVMGPVLAAVRPVLAAQWPLARPPRIVLVPCGRLGAVPWHAARIRGLGRHGHRYACQEAVLSYASSGTQFLAAATRRRMPPAAGPQVLVADPQLTLPWAEVETAALHAACYPHALRYGEFVGTGEPGDASGTPAELLAVLPGGASPASVIHLSCHAVAAPRPTDSALWLAEPPGARREAGRLTVAGIIDGAAGRRPDSAGPLVVLSACETDLSTRHHDEALTLATALVAGGAADVVGSRWAVREGPTAVMMAVFHHHLTAGGLAPPDALRAAQLWMINPRRRLPLPLDGPLRREATRSDLHRLHHWAAFTHQGNPAASPTS
ncbi:CHAT domain-containing protein [Streptomyces sp. CoH27]|uniref:CHAT domain-containing protein n=1 Tax=Streptomyces sp. CoH27 TaxID=2875763 RepID=UPI001CD783B8|nr:CHAT domain-containing protein [Streptomyces sp. CoH27]